MCAGEGQPPLFSDLIDLASYPAGDCRIDDVALSPGRRISGRLSDDSPRPIIRGQVGFVTALSFSDKPNWENSIIWQDAVRTNEDGLYDFPSVPRKQSFELIADCRGWVSVTPSPEQIQQFSKETTIEQAQRDHEGYVLPQRFAADRSDLIEIKMEPLASCQVTVQDNKGARIPNVSVYMSSYNCWSPGFTQGVGYYGRTSMTLGLEKQEAYRVTNQLWDDDGAGSRQNVTDSNGQVTIRNLAGKKKLRVIADHPDFELPPNLERPFQRWDTVDLTSGNSSEIKLTLQRKGTEIIGK